MADGRADAVIVGAGVNGLACGVHLATRGWKVVVLERAAEPGGAVKSGMYTLPGFRHDWAAMNLSLFAGSPFFKAHGAALAARGLEFAPARDCFASVFEDGTWLGVSADADKTTAWIAAVSAADAAAWERLTAAFPAEAEHLFGLLNAPGRLRAFAGVFWRAWRKKGTAGTLDLGRFLLSSPRAWLTETFESGKVRALLAAWGMHLDFAPDVAGGALFPYLEGMAGQAFGMVLGKGGADTVVRAMVAEIEARGGSVRCGAEVTGLVRAGGRVTGVETTAGRVMADRAVVANLAPGALGRLVGDSGDAGYDAGLRRFAHAPGTMMIHLAVSGLPDWTAGEKLKDFAYVHIAPDLDGMARTYAQAQAGLLPDRPVIVVGQPTAVDPSRAPEGRHVLWLQVRMAPGEIRGDAAGQIAARDWAAAGEPFAERALDIVERFAPGLRGKMLGKRIVTPAELEAENPNLVGGDQVCGSHHLSQHFLFRPMRGRADGSTPLAGLWHTGAAVWPGAGTGAGAGYHLGRKLAG